MKQTIEISTQMGYAEFMADSFRKASLPELSEEEKARPFSKYYYEDMPAPDPKHMAAMDQPVDPCSAISPEQLNDLLDPGYLDVEIGWCNMPNGSGFIANKTLYPDVTAEMIDWWFSWHTLEDLRYRIWYPPQHAGIMVSPESRRRLLDGTVPFAERNWGVVHHVVENCNNGMEHVDITFMSPADFGFDMSRFKRPAVATFAGGCGWAYPVVKDDDSIVAPAIMCHIFREVEGGLEHRTRFWMGYWFNESGKPEVCLPPGEQVPVAAVQGLARHNVSEFTRFRDFLPRIFKELGGKMEA